MERRRRHSTFAGISPRRRRPDTTSGASSGETSDRHDRFRQVLYRRSRRRSPDKGSPRDFVVRQPLTDFRRPRHPSTFTNRYQPLAEEDHALDFVAPPLLSRNIPALMPPNLFLNRLPGLSPRLLPPSSSPAMRFLLLPTICLRVTPPPLALSCSNLGLLRRLTPLLPLLHLTRPMLRPCCLPPRTLTPLLLRLLLSLSPTPSLRCLPLRDISFQRMLCSSLVHPRLTHLPLRQTQALQFSKRIAPLTIVNFGSSTLSPSTPTPTLLSRAPGSPPLFAGQSGTSSTKPTR